MKTCYVERNFTIDSLAVIAKANDIIAEYKMQGYQLTLRQLYYQFVSRDFIANKQSEYKRLGSIINDARLAGLVDWEAIVDRTRSVRKKGHWNSPSEIVRACAMQYHVDMWATQKYRPQVWIEKDALIGVIEGVCEELDVPFLSCRGYTSQSEMWSSAQTCMQHITDDQEPVIIHLGDHDPSGLDMSRDIKERLEMFGIEDINFRRIALNSDQVAQYNPPPNPAKQTDSRFTGYESIHGNESWELDALEPAVLSGLVQDAVSLFIDRKAWRAKQKEAEAGRNLLRKLAADMS